jgi:hypothetical protein
MGTSQNFVFCLFQKVWGDHGLEDKNPRMIFMILV